MNDITTIKKNPKPYKSVLTDFSLNVERFYELNPFFYDKARIFWIWDEKRFCYEICDEAGIIMLLDKKLRFHGNSAITYVRREHLSHLQIKGRKVTPRPAKKNWVQFGKWVCNIKVGTNFGKEGFEANPHYFLTNPIPWEVGTSSNTPMIDKLFCDWVGEEDAKTLFEIIAYCCLADYPIHRIFALVGSGRNGKSVYQRLLAKFLGKENCCSSDLDILTNNNFETFNLYKKLVCQMGETDWGILTKSSLLKKLCGQDLIRYEQKGKDTFTSYNYAKIIINSNSLPTTGDSSEGFFRRWVVIKFSNEFPEGKDILDEVPDWEFNNLARKVIEILPKILEEGKLSGEGTIAERKKRYIQASNPFPSFVDEFCEKGENYYILKTRLFQTYMEYLSLIKSRKVSRKEFTRAMEEEGFYVSNTRREVPNPERFGEMMFKGGWWVDGLRLKDNFLQHLQHLQHSSGVGSTIRYNQPRNHVALVENVAKPISTISPNKTMQIQKEKQEYRNTMIQVTKDIILTNVSKLPIRIEELLERLEKKGHPRSVVEPLLEKMLSAGDVYEPQAGLIAKL